MDTNANAATIPAADKEIIRLIALDVDAQHGDTPNPLVIGMMTVAMFQLYRTLHARIVAAEQRTAALEEKYEHVREALRYAEDDANAYAEIEDLMWGNEDDEDDD